MRVATNIKATALALLAFILSALAPRPLWAEPPSVVVSLPPLHSLVASVMGEIASPYLMLRGGRSPHTASLKPSDVKRLRNASLIVWVGPAMESYLAKPIAAVGRDTTVLTLLDLPSLQRLARRKGGVWAVHSHHHDAPKGLSDAVIDSHVWLSPKNAVVIAGSVAKALRKEDPVNADAYQRNVRDLVARIGKQERDLKATLTPVAQVPYLVFHDAYQYFEQHFGLRAVGAVSIEPERRPGARRIADIRKRIERSGVRCVFREPQFPPRLIDTITKGTAARTGVLDPLGAAIPPGPDQWFGLMSGLGTALAGCLQGNS